MLTGFSIFRNLTNFQHRFMLKNVYSTFQTLFTENSLKTDHDIHYDLYKNGILLDDRAKLNIEKYPYKNFNSFQLDYSNKIFILEGFFSTMKRGEKIEFKPKKFYGSLNMLLSFLNLYENPKKITLNSFVIDNDSMDILSVFLRKNNVFSLSFQNVMFFDEEKFKEMCESLLEKRMIRELEFQGTNLNGPMLNALGGILREFVMMKKFCLINNHVDLNNNLEYLMKGLKKSKRQLIHLDFSNNGLNEYGGKSFNQLKYMKKLENFYINSNYNLGKSLLDIICVLNTSKKFLKQLSFSNCDLNPDQFEILHQKILLESKNLNLLDLTGNERLGPRLNSFNKLSKDIQNSKFKLNDNFE